MSKLVFLACLGGECDGPVAMGMTWAGRAMGAP